MKHINATILLSRENVQHTSPVYVSAPSLKAFGKRVSDAIHRYAERAGVSPIAVNYEVVR